MARAERPFLTAEWRHLAMLNFAIDPRALRPFVPRGTELDDFNGQTFISVVGFLFLNTRVCGIAIPLHRDFEEVNLRFYVRRKGSEGWRRGVAFIREIVPRRAIAWTARAVYGENYVALPMRHLLAPSAAAPDEVLYGWRFGGRECSIRMTAAGQPRAAEPGSEAEFITEHYWGYARRRGDRTTEYRVDHPRWRIREAASAALDLDAATLYGPAFAGALQARPASAFLADGSPVTVMRGVFVQN